MRGSVVRTFYLWFSFAPTHAPSSWTHLFPMECTTLIQLLQLECTTCAMDISDEIILNDLARETECNYISVITFHIDEVISPIPVEKDRAHDPDQSFRQKFMTGVWTWWRWRHCRRKSRPLIIAKKQFYRWFPAFSFFLIEWSWSDYHLLCWRRQMGRSLFMFADASSEDNLKLLDPREDEFKQKRRDISTINDEKTYIVRDVTSDARSMTPVIKCRIFFLVF